MSGPVNAYTLMVSVLDGKKSDSEVGLFVTDTAIEQARSHSRKKGVLTGEELGRSFAWMRPNDLIWNYVVNNYLLGEAPPPFDVLYWNNDTTNLPAQLHSDYLDIFQDRRFRPDKNVEFMDHIVDMSAVTQDGFMVAGVTDHITKYYTNKDFPARADRWLEGASAVEASWWIRWNEWLSVRSGERKNAPKKLGNKAYPPISQAPGEYVFT